LGVLRAHMSDIDIVYYKVVSNATVDCGIGPDRVKKPRKGRVA
jgi:hypothetical protein